MSVAVLVVAVAGRPHGGGPTLRAMAASESMDDAQAAAVASNTVRVWTRELNDRNLVNLEALSCPDTFEHGLLAKRLEAIRNGDFLKPLEIVDTTRFVRDGPKWTVDAFWPTGGAMYEMEIRDGELRVCHLQPAPVP